jgi:putative ABC transport system substrate-binding protein
MTRPLLVFSAVTAILASVITSQAQTAKVYRVAWIAPARPAAEASPTFNTFRQEMRRWGYVEGENITFDLRYVEAKPERISGVVGELVRQNVDVIVAVSQPTVQAAQQATRTIPIVMFGVGDPVATGIVASLSHPGGNITGLSQLSPELSVKRLELLRDVRPGVTRVAVLTNPTNPSNAPQLRDIKAAAHALGIQLQLLEVRAPQDLQRAFQAAMRERAGALIALDDLFIFTQRIQIVGLAEKSRLPAIYGWPEFAESGGLMSYGVEFQDMARRTAILVDRILRGAKPADLPVEQPTKFKLVINLKTAKVLGLTIPSSLRLRADTLIE